MKKIEKILFFFLCAIFSLSIKGEKNMPKLREIEAKRLTTLHKKIGKAMKVVKKRKATKKIAPQKKQKSLCKKIIDNPLFWMSCILAPLWLGVAFYALMGVDVDCAKFEIKEIEYNVLTKYWSQKYKKKYIGCGSEYLAQKKKGYIYARTFALSFYPPYNREKRKLNNEVVFGIQQGIITNCLDIDVLPDVPQAQKEIMMKEATQKAKAVKNQVNEYYKRHSIPELTAWTEEKKEELREILQKLEASFSNRSLTYTFSSAIGFGSCHQATRKIKKFYQNEIDTLDKKLAQAKKERKEALSFSIHRMLPQEDIPEAVEDLILQFEPAHAR